MTKIQVKFDLTGEVAVVTGGAGLLGKEFCRTMAEAGAAVAVIDLNHQLAVAVADALILDGYKATAIQIDVTDQTSVRQMVESVVKAFGPLDSLVNSAALDPKVDPEALKASTTPLGSFEDYPLDAWKQALDVNLTGMYLCWLGGLVTQCRKA